MYYKYSKAKNIEIVGNDKAIIIINHYYLHKNWCVMPGLLLS